MFRALCPTRTDDGLMFLVADLREVLADGISEKFVRGWKSEVGAMTCDP